MQLCAGKIVSNIEQFGQYPLQVNGFNNLDECLEGAMVEGEIESLHSDQTLSSSQEVSFTLCNSCMDIVGLYINVKYACVAIMNSGLCLCSQRWFSKLPPVLTFELSRFEFNQSLGRPEKIHKKLEFPQVIYMDRSEKQILSTVSLVHCSLLQLLLICLFIFLCRYGFMYWRIYPFRSLVQIVQYHYY